MQKDIGSVMGIYPTPVTVVGVVLEDGRTNFLTIAHVGIVEHGLFSISVDQAHTFSQAAIEKNGVVSVSLVNEKMLTAADYCGIAKSATVDKSQVFKHHFDDLNMAPVIDQAPVCMTCKVVSSFSVKNFTNYILEPVHTYVQEEYLNAREKIDYSKVKPVLFEFRNARYLSTGDYLGKCWNMGKDFTAI